MTMRHLRRATTLTALILALGLLTACPDDDDDIDTGIDIEEDVDEFEPDTLVEPDAEPEPDAAPDAAADPDADATADDVETDAFAGPTASLQVVHASPDPSASPVDVYVDDELVLDDLEYRTATGMMPIAAETDLSVEVAPGDSDSAEESVHEQTVNLSEDATRVAVASGVLDPDDFQGEDNGFELRIGEAADSATEADVDLNIFHGSPDATAELGGPVDLVTADGTTLADDLAFGEFTGIQGVAAGIYTIDVQSGDNEQNAATVEADLSEAAGEYFTVVATGFVTPVDPDPADGEPFEIVAFDSEGNAVEFSASE